MREMANHITFTTRDWFWFCIVLALAIGWSAHFRYSWWQEQNFVKNSFPNPATDEELRALMNDAVKEAKMCRDEKDALEHAIVKSLNQQQRAEVDKEKNRYLDWLSATKH